MTYFLAQPRRSSIHCVALMVALHWFVCAFLSLKTAVVLM